MLSLVLPGMTSAIQSWTTHSRSLTDFHSPRNLPLLPVSEVLLPVVTAETRALSVSASTARHLDDDFFISVCWNEVCWQHHSAVATPRWCGMEVKMMVCLLYTSDAADE